MTIVPYTDWGPQTNGFVCPTAEDILAKIEPDQKALISADFDTDPDSVDGVNNGIFARQLAIVWEALRVVHNALNRDNAEGDALDNNGSLTGTARKPARGTTVVASCTLDEGTELVPGEAFASMTDRPEYLFTPVEAFTAPADGTYLVTMVCTTTGPIAVPADTLEQISGPVSGWTAVTNLSAGTTGRNAEDDDEYRLSQEADLAKAGTSTTEAIAADIPYDSDTGEGVPGVLSCRCYQNLTDQVDAYGREPGQIEVVVEVDGTEDDSDIAAAIFEAKPAGCPTYGSVSGTVIDENGDSQPVRWSEITARPVYLSYTLARGAGYLGDTAAKAAIVAALTDRYVIGQSVVALFARAIPLSFEGVSDVTSFAIGFGAGPTEDDNLTITQRERATFDAARITIA